MSVRTSEDFQQQALSFIRDTYRLQVDILPAPGGGFVLFLDLLDLPEYRATGDTKTIVARQALLHLHRVETRRKNSLSGMFNFVKNWRERRECEDRLIRIATLLDSGQSL
jgi:hypothetical protein